MSKNAVVTGAGSGVGRATAIALSQRGWNVALIGRREDALQETARSAAKGTRLLTYPCDIGKCDAVAATAALIRRDLGAIEVLINAAGTNTPKRSLEVLSLADYHAMIDTNLHGAYYLVQAFLPEMRQRQSGTIVNVVSDAGKAANPKAGPGYAVSKFGLTGLTQAINMEERGRGIRACAVFPGDIDTALLDKRPAPPNAEARARMLQSDDIARCILLAIELPDRAVVEEIVIRPR